VSLGGETRAPDSGVAVLFLYLFHDGYRMGLSNVVVERVKPSAVSRIWTNSDFDVPAQNVVLCLPRQITVYLLLVFILYVLGAIFLGLPFGYSCDDCAR
jgi:hypothetical protein